MIFPVLENEAVVQIGDMTRLSACRSFVSKGSEAITKVEIQPDELSDFIDVTSQLGSSEWYLDWSYEGDTRIALAAVRISTTDGEDPVVMTKAISVVSVVDDNLFSADADLTALEPDVIKYTPGGRNSFLNVHREAQIKILEGLDESGVTGSNGHKLTKAAVVDVTEVRAWSRDLTLHLIFKGLINAVDDVFTAKARWYAGEVEKRKARAILRLDLNGDGSLEQCEGLSFATMDLVRR